MNLKKKIKQTKHLPRKWRGPECVSWNKELFHETVRGKAAPSYWGQVSRGMNALLRGLQLNDSCELSI